MYVRVVFGVLAAAFGLSLALGCGDSSEPESAAGDLVAAAEKGDIKEVNLLLSEKVADVNAQDEDGMTALHHAAQSDSRECSQVIESLLDEGADPSIQDSQGRTAADIASQTGNQRALTALTHYN